MPKPIKKRPEKKKKTEDIAVYDELKETIAKRQKTLLAGTVSAIVIIVIAAGVYFFNQNAVSRANDYNAKGYAVFYGLSPETPASAQGRYQEALSLFEKAYGARKSAYSLYYIGASQYELGQYQQAIETLSGLYSRYPGNAQFVPLSLYKLAMAELRLGKNAEALKYLGMMESSSFESLKDMAYYEDARLLESMGKKDEAKRKFLELMEKFPQSPYTIDLKAQEAAQNAPKTGAPQAGAPQKPAEGRK